MEMPRSYMTRVARGNIGRETDKNVTRRKIQHPVGFNRETNGNRDDKEQALIEEENQDAKEAQKARQKIPWLQEFAERNDVQEVMMPIAL